MATIEEILLLLTAFHAYLRWSFVAIYNSLCIISMFVWILVKRAAICENKF